MKKFILVILLVLGSLTLFAAVNDSAQVLSNTQTKELLKLTNEATGKTGFEYNYYFINNEEELVKATSASGNAPRTVTFIFYRVEQAKMKVSILVSNDIDLSDYSGQINNALVTIKPQLESKKYIEGATILLENISTVIETGEHEKKISKIENSHINGRILGIEILEWVLGLAIVIFLIVLIQRYFKARKSTQCKFCKVLMHMTAGDRNNPSVTREYECKICGYKRRFIKK
ncbi:MAG: hypothetical protein NTX05_04640 [Fusobacteria bacterium]|nr:hypothetical protein [Fusobacteriota bacterium]